MTTQEPEEPAQIDFDSILRASERHRRAVAAANALNRDAVFDALTVAGIATVLVDFDGEGDSGQLDGIVAFTGDNPVPLPAASVRIHTAKWNTGSVVPADQPLSDAIEILCYGYLEQEHGGWENNDGAYGAFRFDVHNRTIELEFNGRYTDVHTETRTL